MFSSKVKIRQYLGLLVFLIGMITAGVAYGQTAPNGDAAASNDSVIINENTVRLVALPTLPVTFDGDVPIPATFRIVGRTAGIGNGEEQQPSAVPSSDISGVSMRGYARYVEGANGRIGQIIIVGIERDGKTARLDGFGAAWPISDETVELAADEQLAIEGNQLALSQAIESLEADDDAIEEEEKQQIAPTAEPVSDSVGQSTEGGEKSEYTAPDTTAVSSRESGDDAKTADTTKPERACIDGAIRVDTELGVAFERRQIWLPSKNEYADCYDSQEPSDRYALKKNYASCAVGITGATATSRFQRYYTKSDQIRLVGVCVDDPDLTFDIAEDHAGCQVQITENQAIPHADLGYTNRSGRRVQTRGCAPSLTKPAAALTMMTDECNIRHGDDKAIIRGVQTYTIDGVTHQIGICQDTETVFAHSTDFEGCAVDVDLKRNQAVARSRTIYRNGDGEAVEVRGCRPDRSRIFAISEDRADCEVAVDYDANKAAAQARLVYLDHDRNEVEVRGCGPSSKLRPVNLIIDKTACEMRQDFGGLQIHERATYGYQIEGGSFTAATCRETGQNYALVKDYAACDADVDARVGGAVVTKFKWSYTDTNQTKQNVGACVADVDIKAGIVEDFANCSVDVDFVTGKATPHARLIYNDRSGQVVEIEACRPSVGKPAVTLAARPAGCEARIDLRSSTVYELASYSYSLDGEIKQASDCRESGRTFELTRDYDTCETAIDLTGKRATDHFRMVYQDGADDIIEAASCAPDRQRQFAITEDLAACDVAVDYDAGKAIPNAKLIYQDSNREQIEVRDCAPATSKRSVRLVANNDNCEIRLDVPGLKIYEQAAYSYRLDNAVHEASTCRDTGKSFALIKDFAGCAPDVDQRARQVTTNVRWAYVDARNKQQAAGECAVDPELIFAIIEDHTSCTTAVDYQSGKATPQSRLIYTGRNSQITEVRGCAASGTKAAVTLVAETVSCPAEVDLRRLNVAEKAKYSYQLDGEIKQASDCRETGQTFTLTRDYDSCETAIDLTGKRATDHFRMVYQDGADDIVEAASCAPDRQRQFAITEDLAACDVAVDYDAGKAIPNAKLVYQDSNREQIEVRDCAPATSKRAVSLLADKASCEMRIDLAEKRIHERASYSYRLDGGTFNPATCRETGASFALSKDFDACAVDVDIDGKRASQHFKWAYQDANQQKQFANDCAADPELEYAIYEDFASCTTAVDYQSGRATPLSRLVYLDRNSQITMVRDCLASSSKHPVNLVAKASACEARIDKGAGIVHEAASYSYQLDGEIKQASDCRESGRTFDLTRDYDACDMDVNVGGSRAVDQYQLTYNDGSGQRQNAGSCVADSDRVYSIREERSGCEIEINYETLQAIPQAKLVYNGFGGRVVEVRGCDASSKEQPAALTTDKSSCVMRYDFPGRKAFEKATYTYERSGGSYTAATCRETGASFVLDKGYSACAVETDLNRLTAQARYNWFWVDSEGVHQDLGECIDDPELVFDIREDHTSCKVSLDYDALKAFPQAVLVYNNQHGQLTEVRGCERSLSQLGVPLVSRTDTCPMRHDFSASKSYELGIHTYALNNVIYQAAACTETGISFAHEKIYSNAADQYICAPIIDRDEGEVTLSHRSRISVRGAYKFVSECTPDSSGKLAIVATTDGCTNLSNWKHVIATGVSYGQERFYYMRGSSREYVSACQTSSTTYQHDHQNVGWRYNDEALSAWPTTTVTINTPFGRHVVETGQLLAGAIQQPYTRDGYIDRPNGEFRYEGCSKLLLSDRYEKWERPDETIHHKPIGAGGHKPKGVCSFKATGGWSHTRSVAGVITYGCIGERGNGRDRSTFIGWSTNSTSYESRSGRLIREDGRDMGASSQQRTGNNESDCRQIR